MNDIHDMSISPDGKTLLVGFGQSDYRVWDFPNKQMIRDIRGQAFSQRTDTTTHAMWTPDGQKFALKFKNSCLVYTLNQLSQNNEQEFELDNPVYSIQICENGEKLMIAGRRSCKIYYLVAKDNFKMIKDPLTKESGGCCGGREGSSQQQMIAHIELQSFASGTAMTQIDPIFVNGGNTVIGKWEDCVRVFNYQKEEEPVSMMEAMN